MENYRLLEKHRKKLSAYFALSILISLLIIEAIFLASTFLWKNFDLEKKLEMRYQWVVNIINNIDNYSLKNEDLTKKNIIEKSLKWVTIFKNWEKILWDINSYNLWNENKILNSKNYKYYQDIYKHNDNYYKIIIKSENEFTYYNLLLQYTYFSIFSIPFFIFFFLIWYIFVWKNFKPIKETIDSLETFSWNINHEMKTPLTEIISTLSLTKETKNNYEEAIENSLDSAKKLNKILNSMLWIINIVDSSYIRQKVNIIDEIEKILKEHEKNIKKKNIIIKKRFKSKLYFLYVNKVQLNICIWNIIKNAIKYSYDDSIIKIKFNDWVLQVIDHWIWIEKKNLTNIYERYFRENYTKKWWYWLWLALVKKIIDINKWEINVKSGINKWTNVTLKFN